MIEKEVASCGPDGSVLITDAFAHPHLLHLLFVRMKISIASIEHCDGSRLIGIVFSSSFFFILLLGHLLPCLFEVLIPKILNMMGSHPSTLSSLAHRYSRY